MNAVTPDFVHWFRQSSPYIHAHRGRTFVLQVGGETIADAGFPHLIQDLALLNGLGVRLVLVFGARPQIEARLRERGADIRYVGGLRVTDDAALKCVKEAAGVVRGEIEALLSMGLANSPMAGVRLRTASGNLVTARPLGVRHGVDFCHTGEVRRIDTEAIGQRLKEGAVVLIPPLGYSPTGEIFNLGAPEVAAAIAVALGADKLIILLDAGLAGPAGLLPSNLTPQGLEDWMSQHPDLAQETLHALQAALQACRGGVGRVHLIARECDGALLQELFTREGMGTLLTQEPLERIRPARIDDMGGLMELIAPLEAEGVLVRRSRERLETDIERFILTERDGLILACAALFPYPAERMAELACLVVHPGYRRSGRAEDLLQWVETEAQSLGIRQLFVLTTHTAHWFRERGFEPAALTGLPMARQALYNFRRNSKVFIKTLKGS
ncbi:Amino-acid acetyltransferase [Gammaproteobacteria bacterium]